MSFDFSKKSALRALILVLAVFLFISVIVSPAAAAGEAIRETKNNPTRTKRNSLSADFREYSKDISILLDV